MVFLQKWPFFQFFFLGNIGQENVLDNTLEQKIRLSRLKKQKVQKVDLLTFFHRD